MGTRYDIFISYRRDGGEHTTKILRDQLEELGYKVFFDVESLHFGDFNTKLYSVIDECKDFLLILSPNALDRCENQDDVVRCELEHALHAKKNIVPIILRGFSFPQTLPDPIAVLRYKNGLEANTQFLDAFIDRLQQFLISKPIVSATGTVEAWRNLSVSYDRLGAISQAQGDLTGAKDFYEKDLTIGERRAVETGTVESRRDLSTSCESLCDLPQARDSLQECAPTIAPLPVCACACPMPAQKSGVGLIHKFMSLFARSSASSGKSGRIQHCRACGNPIKQGIRFCLHCGSKVTTETVDVEIKKVEFSAVAPKTLAKGDYTIIKVIMYENAYRYVVDDMLKETDQETTSGIHKVNGGSEVKVILNSPDISIDDNTEVQTWQGGYLNFAFAVFLPEQYTKRNVLFGVTVYVNDVIATKLKFTVKCLTFLEQKISVKREDILSAFMSYASQDRNRVAAIIQGMRKARPDMDVFFDVDSLRSGEDWEKALHREIEQRDILFLCWSHFARQSKWVDAEWRYALSHKGIESIEPIPIEPPGVCPPPDELKSKHFNDKLLYIINAESEK